MVERAQALTLGTAVSSAIKHRVQDWTADLVVRTRSFYLRVGLVSTSKCQAHDAMKPAARARIMRLRAVAVAAE